MRRDEDIRARVDAGDVRGAASILIRELGPGILRYLRVMLRNEVDASEAFSLSAENLWRGLPTFAWRCSLNTWAMRVARNAALNLSNEAWRRRERPFATGEASLIAEEVRSSSLKRTERKKALELLRAELSREDQELLTLRLDQELSWAEVAEVLSVEGDAVEPATLMKRFERLKTRLGKRALEAGFVKK